MLHLIVYFRVFSVIIAYGKDVFLLIFKFLEIFIDRVLKFIYPDKCVVCHKIFSYNDKNIGICDSCMNNFVLFDNDICKWNFENHNGFSMFLYTEEIKNIIHNFKYRDYGYYAKVLGVKMGEFFVEQNLFSADFIIPVPIHWKREKGRGYNQTDILVREISKISGIPAVYDAIIRKRNTQPQFKLNKDMRVKNIYGAFEVVRSDMFVDKDILIVDDIFTTGTTLKECERVIKNTGAKNVYYFTLSSTKTFVDND